MLDRSYKQNPYTLVMLSLDALRDPPQKWEQRKMISIFERQVAPYVALEKARAAILSAT